VTPAPSSGSARPLVVLMCGVAGSGKTTCAQRLEREGYVRLSIDEEVWRRSGRHGVDYPESDCAALSQAAEDALRARLLELVAEGRDVVVDFSFSQRASREHYEQLIESAGGRWRLIYLHADPDVLRRRLAERAQRFDANAAFPITDEILTGFLSGFEVPRGEGEEVVTPHP